jgi:IPT/TIG domain
LLNSRFPRFLTAFLGLICLALLASGNAAAAHLTLGDTAPTESPEARCVAGPFDNLQETAPGFSYEVPTAGVLTSWSTDAAAGAGQELTFKVYRPLGGFEYQVVAVDGPRKLTPSTINTFAISIPVETGDEIGVDDEFSNFEHPSACTFLTGEAEDEVYTAAGNAPSGGTLTFTQPQGPGTLINASAILVPAPTIASLGTISGTTAGGTSVTITGANFAEVESVSFGSTPAGSYSVDSEGQITAISPARGVGPVPVSVTTIAGTANSSEQFTYQAPTTAVTPTPAATPVPPPVAAAPVTCTVPSVEGMKLKVARETVKGAHCALGKNFRKKGANNRNGKVVAQTLKSGTVGPFETVVRVTLGKRRGAS